MTEQERAAWKLQNKFLLAEQVTNRKRSERLEDEADGWPRVELENYRRERIERKEKSMKGYHVEHILDELVDAMTSIDRAYAIAKYGGNDTVVALMLREASDAVATLYQELGVRLITKETK